MCGAKQTWKHIWWQRWENRGKTPANGEPRINAGPLFIPLHPPSLPPARHWDTGGEWTAILILILLSLCGPLAERGWTVSRLLEFATPFFWTLRESEGWERQRENGWQRKRGCLWFGSSIAAHSTSLHHFHGTYCSRRSRHTDESLAQHFGKCTNLLFWGS